MTKLPKTRRNGHGCYETTDGRFRIERSHTNEDGLHDGREWHLWDQHVEECGATDGYWNTFATKREALEAIVEWAN